jgi:hypothetical protein
MGAMAHPHVAEKHYRYSRARSLLHLALQFHKWMGTIIWYHNRSGFREYDDVLSAAAGQSDELESDVGSVRCCLHPSITEPRKRPPNDYPITTNN